MTYTVREHVDEYKTSSLHDCCKRLLKILDTEEESDSGRVFKPTTISSCRTLHIMELGDIINRMKELVGLKNTENNIQ